MKYKEKKISRLRTGRNQEWFQRFYDGNYIGSDFGLAHDVSGDLSDNWRDFNKKYELKKAGWKPFTVTIGEASFSYQDHPLYFILAAAGTLYESDKYGNSIDGEGNADLFSYVTLTTAMSMLQQSWLQGLSDLGRILNSNDPAKAIANNQSLSMKQATPTLFTMSPETNRNYKIARYKLCI